MPRTKVIDEDTYEIIKSSASYQEFLDQMCTERAKVVSADNWGPVEVVARVKALHPKWSAEFDEADLIRVAGEPMRPDTPLFAAVASVARFIREGRQQRIKGDPFDEDTRGKRELKAQQDAEKLKKGGPTTKTTKR